MRGCDAAEQVGVRRLETVATGIVAEVVRAGFQCSSAPDAEVVVTGGPDVQAGLAVFLAEGAGHLRFEGAERHAHALGQVFLGVDDAVQVVGHDDECGGSESRIGLGHIVPESVSQLSSLSLDLMSAQVAKSGRRSSVVIVIM